MDKTSKLPDRDILAASLKPHCPSSMHYSSKLGPVLFGDNNHYAVMSASYDQQRDEYNDHMISAAEDYFIDLAELWRLRKFHMVLKVTFWGNRDSRYRTL